MINAERYPLQWPVGWKRTPPSYREKSRFIQEFARARDGLLKEIDLMGGTLVVLSTNIPLTKDNLPYAKHAQPQDPGAAVYFMRKGKPVSLACDKWRTVAENIRALQLTVEAMRGIDRWGSSELMERSFTGFTALPAPETEPPTAWRNFFGFTNLSWKPTLAEVKNRRNQMLRKSHPDLGTEPDGAMTAKINHAFEEAEKELNQ